MKTLIALSLCSTLAFGIVGCSSNRSMQTVDGNTLVTNGKPKLDKDTGMVSYENAETGKKEQINSQQIKNMKQLDN